MTDRPRIGIQFGGDLDQMVDVALKLRPQITLAALDWGAVETSPGHWDWAEIHRWNALRDKLGWAPQLIWKTYPLHMNSRSFPADLAGERLDSQGVVDRYEAFVAAASKEAGWDAQRSIVIVGNEVDWYKNANPQDADIVVDFLNAA